MTAPERQIENQLIEKLQELKYAYRADIRDRAALEKNFRQKFDALNHVRLSDGEFQRLLDEIVTPDVFTAAHTLRNRNSTYYFANNNARHFAFNADERFLPVYEHALADNSKVKALDAFAEAFLAKCALAETISRYMVLVAGEQKLLMMRPYQIYAVKNIVECIDKNLGNGYVWHTNTRALVDRLLSDDAAEKVIVTSDAASPLLSRASEQNHSGSPAESSGTHGSSPY